MTTGVTDTAIEVAGRRLNPQVLPEWQILLTHIEISEGFSFVVLLVPDADWANACRLALSHSLDAQGKSLLTVNFSDPEDLKSQLPGRLLDLHISERTGAVWLEKTVSGASPQFAEWQDAWRGMVARLNQMRNPLRRHFKVPLIFVGASWIQPLIREIAPDLWSVRTLVTRIHPPQGSGSLHFYADTPSEQQLEGLAIDPDLALRTASRLRGQMGKELALAQLLYRAGLGLNARARWAESAEVLQEAIELERRFQSSERNLAPTMVALGHSLERQFKFEQAQTLMRESQELYRRLSDVIGEGNCLGWLGDIARGYSDDANAQARYEEALQLFRQVGHVSGEATCIQRLGELALARSDHPTAQARFEEALSIFRGIGSVLGEAGCIEKLGDIALERSDYASAEARYEEALPCFRRVGSLLGEANCIESLGDIALQRSDYTTAQARFEEALPLFRRVGSLLGEANCIQSLAEIAVQRSDITIAQACFKEALALYRRSGQVLGEANCIKSLGNIARLQGSLAEARAKYVEALQLFEKIAEPYSIGWSHRRLARLEQNTSAREEHLKAAREAWLQIDRHDLIAELEEEFKTREGNDATDG